MAVNQGFPSAQSQLTSAVRKALFTSAAATAIAVGTPGYAAAAEIACEPGQIGMPMAGDSVTCAGNFDETIRYDVVDTTVVDPTTMEASVVAGDVTVVVTEGSTASGIAVSSVTPAAGETAAQGSVTISNNADITMSGEDGIAIDPSHYVTFDNMGTRITGSNGNYSGYYITGMQSLDTDGRTLIGDRTDFGQEVSVDDIETYLGLDPNVVDVSAKPGPEETLEILVADVGEIALEDVAAVSAEADAGDVTVNNTGDITVGNGASVTYVSEYRELHGGGNFWDVDTDGDGVKDTRFFGGKHQLFIIEDDVHTSIAYAVGIDAHSNSGNVVINNEGNFIGGDITKAIDVSTVDGDIAVSNTGDINAGANSVGIHASAEVQTELMTEYSVVSEALQVNPGRFGAETTYTHTTNIYNVDVLTADGSDTDIVIENAGNMNLGAGSEGIRAENPSGNSIEISNSGDITIAEGTGGNGIVADTTAGLVTQIDDPELQSRETVYYTEGEGAPRAGEDDFNQYGLYYTQTINKFVPGVGKYAAEVDTKHFLETNTIEARGYFDDQGDITISNSGDINVSEAAFGTGIAAVGLGDTTVYNAGNIDIGVRGTGIFSGGTGETNIDNSGSINLHAAGGTGISVTAMPGANTDSVELVGAGADADVAATYGGIHSGDTNVVNNGAIMAMTDTGELTEYNEAGAVEARAAHSFGIRVSALGANMANSDVKWTQYGQGVIDHLGVDVEIDERIELDTVSIINNGDIELSDFANGIDVSTRYGTVVVENHGSVTVGDGGHFAAAGTYSAVTNHSTAIEADNWGMEGFSDHFMLNTGDITGGDMAQGMVSYTWHGSSYVVNEGNITVGDGHVIYADDFEARENNHGALSSGLVSVTAGGFDAYAMAQNSGNITSGNHSYGMVVSNVFTNGVLMTEEFNHIGTAVAVNEGVITTGDHSTGMALNGYVVYGHNTGTINIGSGNMYDRSYVSVAAGMKTIQGTGFQSVLVNSGEINGGNEVAGMFSEAAIAYAVQNEEGSITVQDDAAGMVSRGYFSTAANQGIVTTGDRATGMQAMGTLYSVAYNSGEVTVGEDSIGVDAFAVNARVINTGTIVAGDNSTAVRLSSGVINVVDESGEVVGQRVGYVINEGTIVGGENGLAVESTSDYAAMIINTGTIDGSISMGAGDDLLYNAVQTDEDGLAVAAGRTILRDAAIDLGAGVNRFYNVFGDIIFSGESTIELGDAGSSMDNLSVQDSYVTINSINGETGDSLTINGDVNFTSIQGRNGLFLVDVSSMGSDSVTINGDLTAADQVNAEGDTVPSSLGVAMNVVNQGKGTVTTDAVLTVNGEVDVANVVLTGIGGEFADTILTAELQDNGEGEWSISYTAGLSHLGTAAATVSHLAEGLWLRSASSFQDSERAANAAETRVAGLEVWTNGFHSDSDVDSQGDLAEQAMGYTQLLNGTTLGATYAAKLGDSWFTVTPMVGMGSAESNQVEQQSNASLEAETLAISGSWSMADFYASAMYQSIDFDAGINAYNSSGMTSGNAHGFSLEAGWTYATESGIALTPFAQWSDVKVEMDAFTSSDGAFNYAYDLGNSKQARLGLNLSKSFKVKDGFVVPYATFSAVDLTNANNHDLHSNGVSFGSDVSGSGMQIDFGVDGQYKAWSVKGGLGVHSGDVDKNGISGHFTVSRSL